MLVLSQSPFTAKVDKIQSMTTRRRKKKAAVSTTPAPAGITPVDLAHLREVAETWDHWMILSLVAVGIAGVAVGLTTYYSIRWNGRVRAAENAEFAAYKLDAGRQIAGLELQSKEADTRLAEAQTALEREKVERLQLAEKVGPRHLSEQEQAVLLEVAKVKNAISIEHVSEMEPGIVADEIEKFLHAQGITKTRIQAIGTLIPPMYGVGFNDPDGPSGAFTTLLQRLAPNANVRYEKHNDEGEWADVPSIVVYSKPISK